MQSKAAESLLQSIEALKRSDIKTLVDQRIREFRDAGQKPSREIFKELCFCILCANYMAEGSMKIQNAVEDGFLTLPEPQLAERLKALGYRFPNVRTKYIVEARQYKDSLKRVIYSFKNSSELREWLITNIKGIGSKEASHFLRNIGYNDFAILDFHIINILARHGLIKKPKTLTSRRYLEIEALLRKIAEKVNLTLAELDLYLWYIETGRVLK
ncbi:MAG: N-glycosylase/DNA lyase [Candidatus Bathyarchaeota archaeon]|nr:N-glycosylase/DNA lyase [Candidatus Bathyarchaeota archaeon]